MLQFHEGDRYGTQLNREQYNLAIGMPKSYVFGALQISTQQKHYVRATSRNGKQENWMYTTIEVPQMTSHSTRYIGGRKQLRASSV